MYPLLWNILDQDAIHRTALSLHSSLANIAHGQAFELLTVHFAALAALLLFERYSVVEDLRQSMRLTLHTNPATDCKMFCSWRSYPH